jgi:hypothetical protein
MRSADFFFSSSNITPYGPKTCPIYLVILMALSTETSDWWIFIPGATPRIWKQQITNLWKASDGCSTIHSWTLTLASLPGSFTSGANSRLYKLKKRLVGHQNRSGRFWKEKNSFVCIESDLGSTVEQSVTGLRYPSYADASLLMAM